LSKEKKKGLFDFLKKPKSGCCDMEIIEIGKEKKVKKGCCDFEIVPNDVKEESKK
jgi:hypothetical protein